jgi:hypothetical protein
MKRLFVTLLLAIGFMGVYAQKAPASKNMPQFKFKDKNDTYDFGTLKEGPVAEHVFEFTNVGKEPLIIQSASASCGCTTPEWPKEPILPGKNGKITVRYNTQGRVAPFTKEIYIQSNAFVPEGKERYTLNIKGTVVAAQQGAPTNKN